MLPPREACRWNGPTCLPEIKAINLDIFTPWLHSLIYFYPQKGSKFILKIYRSKFILLPGIAGSPSFSPKVREAFAGQMERSWELCSWPFPLNGDYVRRLRKLEKLKLQDQRQTMCSSPESLGSGSWRVMCRWCSQAGLQSFWKAVPGALVVRTFLPMQRLGDVGLILWGSPEEGHGNSL